MKNTTGVTLTTKYRLQKLIIETIDLAIANSHCMGVEEKSLIYSTVRSLEIAVTLIEKRIETINQEKQNKK